jgi:hypothetical protein
VRIKIHQIALCAIAPSLVFAQPTGAQAETLFERGRELMLRQQYVEACTSFEASQKLEASTATLVNLADCRERNSQLATAWGLYLQAERELRAVTDANGVKLRELVKTRAAALEPRLSKLTINVPPTSQIPQLEIIRDNDRVEPGAWNQPLPVDGATLKISARAPERREWSTTVTIGVERDAQVVDIPALVAFAQPTDSSVPPATVEVESSEPPGSRVPIIFGAAAIGLAGAGLGFELWGRGIYDDAESSPDRDKQEDLWRAANTRRYVAIGLGVAAIAAASTSIVLYVRGRRAESPTTERSRVTVSPVARAGFGGLLLDGRW